MNGFLKEVALSVVKSHGRNISDLNVVFSSRRAQRYFDIELSEVGCLYKPNYSTINELINDLGSTLHVADKLKLITLLYNIYNQFYPTEKFEQFYSFGQLLLNDFDTVDRYMVDARALYSIVSDTLTLESAGDDPARLAAINFWRTFQHSKAHMHEQQQFLKIWESLYEIYSKYKVVLQNHGIAYEGMIYRQVAEKMQEEDKCVDKKYVFIGLNALSTSEQEILRQFQKSNNTTFYWDYNQRWIDDDAAEAGYFIRKNLEQFPQAAEFNYSEKNNDKIELSVIDTPSEILQCKTASNRLMELLELQGGEMDSETAVILTDEKLLVPLLYSIPATIPKFNISMGYPLKESLAHLFLERLIALQNHSRVNQASGIAEFYHTDVIQLLLHPYIANNELAKELESSQIFYFSKTELIEKTESCGDLWHRANRGYFDLQSYLFSSIELIINMVKIESEQPFLSAIKSSLIKIQSSISNCNIELSNSLYISLLFEELASQSVDFEGRSGEGLQITGILESRSLDFKNIILLSMSDDNFPSSRSAASYIPRGLREGYGMPSVVEHSAIWSYYFYRLLQRAQSVTMIYCSASDNATSGEPSRYIYQLQYTSPYNIAFKSVIINATRSLRQRPISITKTEKDIETLCCKSYSPSALSRYLRCPLSFYFNDILQITPPDIEVDEMISALDTGDALHKIIQLLYGPYVGKGNIKLIGKSLITSTIDAYLAKNLGSKMELNQGSAKILKTTLERMVGNIVKYDADISADFELVALEQVIEGRVGKIKIKGIVDRVDRMADGTIRIVDYKSGADKTEFKGLGELMGDDPKGHNSAALQTLIYGVIAAPQYRAPITPSLYIARKMSTKNFSPLLNMGGEKIELISENLHSKIESCLQATLSSVCDPNVPFSQSLFPEVCSRCRYSSICRR